MNEFSLRISGVCSQIFLLKKHELSSFIHCSKINSLIQAFKIVPDCILSKFEKGTGSYELRFLDAAIGIIDSVDHLIQLCIQCKREACVQFLLSTSTQYVFEQFLSIRQETIKNLKTLCLDKCTEGFTLTPDILLSQDQIDLKRIAGFLQNLLSQHELKSRDDVVKKINERFESIKRKGISIEQSEEAFISLPSLPAELNLVLDHEQIQYGGEIGRGCSGRVFSGKITGRNETVAIKVLHQKELKSIQMNYLRTEIFTLSTLSHPSILKLLGYTNEPPFCLVTEYLSNGSLSMFLKNRGEELSPTDRTAIAIDVARGMSYIHERNIIHRDLKSLNILLDDKNRARICDFGLVRLKSFSTMTGQVGTPQWMAPEVMMSSHSYDSKVDVFSFGVVLWELLTGKMPYSEYSVFQIPILVVQDNIRPVIPEGTPDELSTLISACWSSDPSKRPTFEQINHLFNNGKYHFPGTNEDLLWEMVGGKKRKSISISDPVFINMESQLVQSIPKDIHKLKRQPHGIIDRLLSKLNDSVQTQNFALLEKSLNDLKSYHKSNLLSSTNPILIKELMRLTEMTNAESRALLMKCFQELLTCKDICEKFWINSGMSFLLKIMNDHTPSVALSVISIIDDNLEENLINVDMLKSILAYSDSLDIYVRSKASDILCRMIELRFDFICSMPYFLYHLLIYPIKGIQRKSLLLLMNCASEVIHNISVFPDMVLDQLLWIHENSDNEIQKIVIQCIVTSSKFINVQNDMPSTFWAKAIKDYLLNEPIFVAFSRYLPSSCKEMIHSIIKVSCIYSSALEILVSVTKLHKCAVCAIPLIPVKNTHDYALMLKFYMNLSSINGSELIIGEESEFYIVCMENIKSENQRAVCELIRYAGLNPVLLESSGLILNITQIVLSSRSSDELWNMLSVIYTISQERYFSCFNDLHQKLEELILQDDLKLKRASFLCCSNFLKYTDLSFKQDLLQLAASFIYSDQFSVQQACIRIAEKIDTPIARISEIIQSFNACFKQADSTISFRSLLERIEKL